MPNDQLNIMRKSHGFKNEHQSNTLPSIRKKLRKYWSLIFKGNLKEGSGISTEITVRKILIKFHASYLISKIIFQRFWKRFLVRFFEGDD